MTKSGFGIAGFCLLTLAVRGLGVLDGLFGLSFARQSLLFHPSEQAITVDDAKGDSLRGVAKMGKARNELLARGRLPNVVEPVFVLDRGAHSNGLLYGEEFVPISLTNTRNHN